ncbi:MAG: hypothetical protein CMI18_11185 [Opitutaceae bacterium]|nr:hypothetical protein [Opitutaceae bacterium]
MNSALRFQRKDFDIFTSNISGAIVRIFAPFKRLRGTNMIKFSFTYKSLKNNLPRIDLLF